jgi:signal transduction histidine kinase
VHLSDFIRDNMEELLLEWEVFAQTLLRPGKELDRAGLRDDAESLLRAIALDMELAQSPEEQFLKSRGGRRRERSAVPRPAITHAHERYVIGFDLDQLVAEYRAVRASVIRLWTQKMGHADQATLQELTRFNEAVDEVLADSVARYGATVERAKNLFLAVLGHDLRTPLSAVLAGASAILKSEEESDGNVKTAAMILRSGMRMSQMVADLVDFTRARLGNAVPLVRVPMDLGVTVGEVLAEIEAAHPHHTLRLATSGDLRGSWDSPRMKQALANLIQNAVHHGTANTPISVSVNGLGGQVVLTVHNSGPPIPEQDRERIFEPLVSAAETSSPLVSPHIGLGLYITRQIVQDHGGTIGVESAELAGTTFTMSLPRQ